MTSSEAINAVALDVDFVFVTLVLFVLFGCFFLAIWGVAQRSASHGDVAGLIERVSGLEHKVDIADARVADVERKISHLPTGDQVHAVELRLERLTTAFEAVSRQTERVHDYLMSEAKRVVASQRNADEEAR
ncbi:DUF2730 family protein [Methylopila sp. M107]|uniref:DUF2730 family protein n=1 Tax=Methylopila sp. M107 TaxID=1101190 RepID=UPI0003755EDF|nr:DUF2730 family protein [Methylopila sp. M107]